MPYLSLRPALKSWRLNDTIQVMRRQQTVDSLGRTAETVVATFNIRGVVGAVAPDQLERLPDYQAQHKTISILTTTPLNGAMSSAEGPDQVVWNGDTYQVLAVDDWSRYGVGYINATCGIVQAQPNNVA